MTWTVGWPTGNISVKNNKTPGQNNMAYIETTAQVDHYFDEGAGFDGHHKFVKMPVQAADVAPGANMDGAIYLKSDGTRVEGFYQNSNGVYQFIPAFLSGTVSITSTSTYVTVSAVPANVYGDIHMWTTALGKYSSIKGHFRSNGTTVEAWTLTQADDSTATNVPIKLGNGSQTDNLNITARRSDAGSATWNYRITYRAI